MRRRVYVSMPADAWLTPAENELKWAIVAKIEARGLQAEVFHDPRGTDSISAGLAWTAERADDIMRRCVGAALIGLPRWTFRVRKGAVKLATDSCHYEGAVAHARQLPCFLLIQKDVEHRVVFEESFGHFAEMPPGVDTSWLDQKEFTAPFGIWQREVARRHDVFLGYCSSSVSVAKKIKTRLKN